MAINGRSNREFTAMSFDKQQMSGERPANHYVYTFTVSCIRRRLTAEGMLSGCSSVRSCVIHYTDPTRLCWTKFGWVRSGLRQVGGLCLVVDLSAQSRHVRILSWVWSGRRPSPWARVVEFRNDTTGPDQRQFFFRIYSTLT